MPAVPKARPAHLKDPACLVALGFGAGLMPFWPGTFGALVAFPLFLSLRGLPLFITAITWLFFLGVGFAACDRACKTLGKDDHGQVVWDETVGMLLVLLTSPKGWPWWLAAFLTFRFFDIVKPWPVRLADVHARGGVAVMMDDVLAAAYAIALLWLAHAFTG